MIYLESVKIVKKTIPGSDVLKKGFSFDCSDVNILVGNQGAGKSTLLKMIQKNNDDIDIVLSEATRKNGVRSYYFDSEHDNPRTKNSELYTTPDGRDVGMGLRNALMSRWQSHGEVIEKMIIDPLSSAKDCVIIFDEPESGLSIQNQFKLIQAIEKAVENKCQFFIATHCYPLIKEFNVISLDHWKQMPGTEFIQQSVGKTW